MNKEEIIARIILELSKALSVLLAAIFGFCIGFERKLRSKEAGIRTHTLVCMASSLLMVVGKYGFNDVNTADKARIAAQVVSGIGFLGAGIIMLRGQRMRGLTTAAGVWATAAIGMACGAEMWIIAGIATILLIGVQCLLHSNIKLFRSKQTFMVKIRFRHEEDAVMKLKKIFGVEHFKNLVIERTGEEVRYSATLYTNREFSSIQLDEIMEQNPYVDTIERCDYE